MALHDPLPKLTYEDYVLFPDNGTRHEIIDGELFVTAAPFVWHQEIVLRLSLALGGFLRTHRLGRLLFAPLDVIFSPHDVLQPDLFFVSRDRTGIIHKKNVQGAPDLVIEILSDSTHRLDRGDKRSTYERFGVREYWLVDAERRSVEILGLDKGRFHRQALLTAMAGDSLATQLLPGFSVPLVEIFAPEE